MDETVNFFVLRILWISDVVKAQRPSQRAPILDNPQLVFIVNNFVIYSALHIPLPINFSDLRHHALLALLVKKLVEIYHLHVYKLLVWWLHLLFLRGLRVLRLFLPGSLNFFNLGFCQEHPQVAWWFLAGCARSWKVIALLKFESTLAYVTLVYYFPFQFRQICDLPAVHLPVFRNWLDQILVNRLRSDVRFISCQISRNFMW